MTSNSTKAISVVLQAIRNRQGYEIWAVYPYDRREMLAALSPSVGLLTARQIASVFAIQQQLDQFQEM